MEPGGNRPFNYLSCFVPVNNIQSEAGGYPQLPILRPITAQYQPSLQLNQRPIGNLYPTAHPQNFYNFSQTLKNHLPLNNHPQMIVLPPPPPPLPTSPRCPPPPPLPPGPPPMPIADSQEAVNKTNGTVIISKNCIIDIINKLTESKGRKRVAIILRGLPGSGKSLIAKKIRDKMVSEGLEAPRILSLDDYFMTEMERVVLDDKEGKEKKIIDLVYKHDREMEGMYHQNLVKSYIRTLISGHFNSVIMDAPNIKILDFKDCLVAAQRYGFEIFVLDPIVTDPKICLLQNLHKRHLAEMMSMAENWEHCPSIYPLLDVHKLLNNQNSVHTDLIPIKEFEMEGELESSGDGDREMKKNKKLKKLSLKNGCGHMGIEKRKHGKRPEMAESSKSKLLENIKKGE